MKINKQLLNEQLKATAGFVGLDQAKYYADDFADLLTQRVSDALFEHHIYVSKKATHDSGVVDNGVIRFSMFFDNDEFIRPSMSTMKDYDPANMFYLFDVGWDMSPDKMITEYVDDHPIYSRTSYDGEHYISLACKEFNDRSPDGVVATPSDEFI